MSGTNIIVGQHPTNGTRYAAVDSTARYVTPRVADLQFASLLSPFPDEAATKAALEAEGCEL